MTPMPLGQGSVVGTYRLVEQLGRGGQGSVWKCADPVDRAAHRALKLIRLLDATPVEIERIRREGHLLSSLRHPSIVGCQGIVEDLRAGFLALVMDLVDGEPLTHAMRDPRFSAGHREAVLDHLAGALAYLHDSSVVHRDVKLENVVLRSGFWHHPNDPSMVKLVDFGIAVTQGNQHGLTRTGTVVGTLAYMPPEVLDPNRWPAAAAPSAADVWGFGVLGWILLTGVHPTGLSPTATITDLARAYDEANGQRRVFPGPRPRGRWGRVLERCLVLSPANRLRDGRAILQATRQQAVPVHTEAHAPSRRLHNPGTNTTPASDVPPWWKHAPRLSARTEARLIEVVTAVCLIVAALWVVGVIGRVGAGCVDQNGRKADPIESRGKGSVR